MTSLLHLLFPGVPVSGRYSERQIGSFYTICTIKGIEVPKKKIIENHRATRNKYIHKGYIAHENDAVDYCKTIVKLISKADEHLHSNK